MFPRLRTALLFIIVFIVAGVCTVPWPELWEDSIPGDNFALAKENIAIFLSAADHPAYEEIDWRDIWSQKAPTPLAIIFSPFTKKFGPEISINLAAWLGLFFTFLCAYLFFWEISGDFYPGIIGGAIFAFSPYCLGEIGAGFIATGTPFVIPLALFFFIRFVDKGGAVYGISAALLMVAGAWYYYTFGMLILIFAVMATIAAFFDEGLKAAGRGLFVTVISIALYIPILNRTNFSGFRLKFNNVAVDLLSIFYPTDFSGYTFPVIALIGACISSLFIKDKRLFWWAGAGVFFLFALGPYVVIAGRIAGIPGPAAILEFSWKSAPVFYADQCIIGCQLCLCALIAMGHRALLERLEAKEKDISLATRGILFLILIFAVIFAPGETVSIPILTDELINHPPLF